MTNPFPSAGLPHNQYCNLDSPSQAGSLEGLSEMQMKAKEYARIFKETDDLGDIAKRFLLECRELMEKRRASTDPAIFAIFNEQSQKWRAFARIAGGVKEDGFEIAVKLEMPEWVYSAWIKYRGGV